MKEITITEFQRVLAEKQADARYDFINVCTPAEYQEKHIEGVRNLPLDELSTRVEELQEKEHIYVHCRSGRRAQQALEQLQRLGITAELVNVSGGLTAWDEAGLPTGSHTNRLPIMRQVLIAAGALVLLSASVGYFLTPWGYALATFVGAGLFVSGATGWCGMAYLLARMPWNQ